MFFPCLKSLFFNVLEEQRQTRKNLAVFLSPLTTSANPEDTYSHLLHHFNSNLLKGKEKETCLRADSEKEV